MLNGLQIGETLMFSLIPNKENKMSDYAVDFLKEMGLDRIKMNAGGISRKALLDMLKNEYPKEFARLKAGNLSDKDLKRILDNLDKDGVPFNNGGLVSNYKKEARKP